MRCPSRVIEVDAAAIVTRVDLARAVAARVGVVVDPVLAHPHEGRIEFILTDEECMVLRGDGRLAPGVVQG